MTLHVFIALHLAQTLHVYVLYLGVVVRFSVVFVSVCECIYSRFKGCLFVNESLVVFVPLQACPCITHTLEPLFSSLQGCVWLTSVLTTMYDYMLLVQYRYIYKSLDLYCYSQF